MAGDGLETRKYLEKLTVAVHCVTQAATVFPVKIRHSDQCALPQLSHEVLPEEGASQGSLPEHGQTYQSENTKNIDHACDQQCHI